MCVRVCVHLDAYKCAHVYMSVVHAHLYFCVCFINVHGKCSDCSIRVFVMYTVVFVVYTAWHRHVVLLQEVFCFLN